ncbi:MAG: histidine--tRNA ligase, partial [Flavobacteriales bacterium]
IDGLLSSLKVPDYTIKVNNRKVLYGIAEYIDHADKFNDLTVEIDKRDKLSEEELKKNISDLGIQKEPTQMVMDSTISTMDNIFQNDMELNHENLISENQKAIDNLSQKFDNRSETGKKGLAEMQELLRLTEGYADINGFVEFDPGLARGLDYYTGTIFEVVVRDFPSSICGGGRYDYLTGVFGLKDVSGVGISFGADRIYDLLQEKGLFPDDIDISTKVLFVNFGEEAQDKSLELINELRKNDISAEIYPEAVKMKKQMKYANFKGVEYVAILGDDEFNNKEITLKNMASGEQERVKWDVLVDRIKS